MSVSGAEVGGGVGGREGVPRVAWEAYTPGYTVGYIPSMVQGGIPGMVQGGIPSMAPPRVYPGCNTPSMPPCMPVY